MIILNPPPQNRNIIIVFVIDNYKKFWSLSVFKINEHRLNFWNPQTGEKCIGGKRAQTTKYIKTGQRQWFKLTLHLNLILKIAES